MLKNKVLTFTIIILSIIFLVSFCGKKRPDEPPKIKDLDQKEITTPDTKSKDEVKKDDTTTTPENTASNVDKLEIKTKTVPATYYFYKTYIGEPWTVKAEFDKIKTELPKLNIADKVKEPIGIYLDDPSKVDPKNCRNNIGYLLKEKVDLKEPYKVDELKQAGVVYAEYEGTSKDIQKAYEKLAKYITDHNLIISASSQEIYLNEVNDPSKDKMKIEIRFPVEPAIFFD